jgi:tetratricopeptide (TPR) repeat protein
VIPLLLLCLQIPDESFQRGMELARVGQWEEARATFLEASAVAPFDKRFPLELAGVEYRLGRNAAAQRHLQRALRLDPLDNYGNEFLATLYYLDGNYEAALVYWNRIGKPRLSRVAVDPPPAMRAALLDRALMFAPGETLTVREYRSTQGRLEMLDVFPRFRIDLASRPGQQFDARVNWIAPSRWGAALSALGELPFQAVRLDLRNVAHRAITWDNFLRWDAQKRRVSSSVSGPLFGDPKWRGRLFADARSETWNLGGGQDFRLRKVAAGAELRLLASDRVAWSSALDFATRHFPNAPGFAQGFSAKYRAAMDYKLLSLPERRLNANVSGMSEIGRLLSGSGGLFSRAQATLAARWFPQARGEDYETNVRVSAGGAFGRTPFDELFMLGLERDNDLPLRGHIGTRDGKKGSAPIGRRYFLTNFGVLKQIYRGSWFTVDAGPAVDTGLMWDALPTLGADKLLVDAGAELRFRVLGNFGVILSYARDLRGGKGAFYPYPIR